MSSLKGNVSSTQSLNGGTAINVAVTPNITIGKVTTLAPDSNVIVELDESSTRMNPVFNFGIPEGKTGEKGEAGSVRFIIANELPNEDIDLSAIYMIPSGATTEGNTYQEYIYVNGDWESLGSASVNVDMADYVKKTDIATGTTAGLCTISYNKYTSGLNIDSRGMISIAMADNSQIDAKSSKVQPIVPANLDYAVKSVGDGYYVKETEFNEALGDIETLLGGI